MYDVAIIDYKMGNLYSLFCACEYSKLKTVITDDEKVIKNSKSIILPGVGAFPKAMEIIQKKKIR